MGDAIQLLNWLFLSGDESFTVRPFRHEEIVSTTEDSEARGVA